MARIISLDEAYGATPEAVPGETPVAAKPTGRIRSLDEAYGAVEPTSVGGFLKNPQSWKDMAGYAAGAGAQLSDMFTGIGKSLLGSGAYLIERGETKGAAVKQAPLAAYDGRLPVKGDAGSTKRSAAKAQTVKDQFPEELAAPWKKVADAMGPEAQAAYNENGIGWVMGKVSELIEHGGKKAQESWGVPASDVVNAVDMFMGVLGAKALKPGAQQMLRARLGELTTDLKTAKGNRSLTPEELARAQVGAWEKGGGYPGEAVGPPKPAAGAPVAAVTPEAATPAAPAPKAPLSETLDPYKVPALAAVGVGATAWAMQNQLSDEQLAGLGILGAASMVKLHGVPEPRLIDMMKEGGPSREAAAAQIYRDNVPMLTRSLQKYAKQGVEIEDVVQRTMEKGMRAIEKGQFSGDSAIGTYLYRIADNEAKSGLRYEKVRPRTESLDNTETPGGGKGDESLPSPHENVADTSLTGRSPEQVALNNALGERMSKALDKLPENFRRPFELSELEGLSDAEIAAQLGQPIGTVKSQISRAKEQLRQALREYGPKGAMAEAGAGAVMKAANEGTLRPDTGQAGRASPEQIFTLAAITGGASLSAFLNQDNPLKASIYGALAGGFLGSAKGRVVLKQAIKKPDVFLGLISTRLGNIAPELKGHIRLHELRVLKALSTTHDQVTPFLQALKKQSEGTQTLIARDLLNGRLDTLNKIPELAKTYPAVKATLKAIEGQLVALGRFGEGVGEYFPRIIKDYEGLKAALSQPVREGLEAVLADAEAAMTRKKQRSLTEVERSVIANRYLFADGPGSFQPGYAHARKIREVTEKLQPFYEKPAESLLRYVSGAITDVETARFFGRDLKVTAKGEKKFTNLDESIGNLTARLIEQKKITPKQAMEVRDILRARFGPGDKSMSPTLGMVRDLTNAGLLGNVVSAATQIGDSFLSVYHFGLVPTLQALTEKLIGREKVTPKELGMVNHLAEELSGGRIAGRVLQNALKYSGFSAIDLFAKGLGINAALIKAQRMARTPGGRAKLAERYGYAFENDLPQLIQDLATRADTPRTQRLAFEALSDIQPVSRAELPQAYLEHPNGRLLYQLKTYMLKQADVVRRDAYDNIAKGTPAGIARGIKNLGALATVYAVANVPGDVIKDWLSGRESDPLSTPKLVENVLQTFGLNRYATERLGQGKIVDTLIGAATPPLKVLEDIAAGRDKAISYIPGAGRIIYDRYFDGNVKREISEKRSANKGLPKGEGQQLSDEAKAYLERLKEERKLKAESR